MVARAQGEVGMGLTANNYRVSFWNEGTVLDFDGGDGCTIVRTQKIPTKYIL